MPRHLFLLTLFATAPMMAAEKLSGPELEFFEAKIRPVLVEKCYGCHSEKAEKVRGGLLLDTREGARRGGDTGPAVVPGKVEESLLIQAVRYADEDTAMPPKKQGGKLPDAVIADFEKWVAMGAPDPREGGARVVTAWDAAKAADWWAFQPIRTPAVPNVKAADWPTTELDRFVLAGLEAHGLTPAPRADTLALLRRVFFDLTGLPPGRKDVQDFLADASPNALEKVVDRLLASSAYGERWGRHWLDVARYAESSGKDENITFPHAWRYRDYVIAAFNADKPYDQFVREQIAGDLLPAASDLQRAQQRIATGFLALGPKGLNEPSSRQFLLDVADEQIDTMSQAMLGLTVSCARCHDHKFDPVSQKEYYALAGIFLSSETRYGTTLGLQNRHPGELLEVPDAPEMKAVQKALGTAERAKLEKQLAELTAARDKVIGEGIRKAIMEGGKPAKAGEKIEDPEAGLRFLFSLIQISQIENQLKASTAGGSIQHLCMGMQDLPSGKGEKPGEAIRRRIVAGFGGRALDFSLINDAALQVRGEADKPGEKVARGVPKVMAPGGFPVIARGVSGRKELADSLTAEHNTLLARVMANRVWHWLFGRGIVASTDNFGTSGQMPSNPELLDFLAVRLRANGWSVKKLIREIVLSRTYAMSSAHHEGNFAKDPDNQHCWRMSRRRLDAECIRDAMLRVSGQLVDEPPVGSAVAHAGDSVINSPFKRGSNEDVLLEENRHRSVYLAVVRDMLPDSLEVFDFPDPSLVAGRREVTNVPAQALWLMNSDFATEQAEALAKKLLAEFPGTSTSGLLDQFEARYRMAFALCFSRIPTSEEVAAGKKFHTRHASAIDGATAKGSVKKDAALAAWTSLCRALFASTEFRYLD